jgi:hypothetical protein
MRVMMLAGAVLLGAAAAHAASIDTIAPDNRQTSIEQVTCQACGPYNPKSEAVVQDIELAPGQQKVEIREINGEKKIFRTQAWFGGSPVVVVSKAYGETKPDQTADLDQPVLIDPNQTTSVTADMSGAEVPAATRPDAKAFDAKRMELRLK